MQIQLVMQLQLVDDAVCIDKPYACMLVMSCLIRWANIVEPVMCVLEAASESYTAPTSSKHDMQTSGES